MPDRRHRVRDLSVDTSVWVNTREMQTPSRVTRADTAPRSYWVQTPSGEVRRNRRDGIVQPNLKNPQESSEETQKQTSAPNVITTRSHTRALIKPPERLTYS